MSALRNMTPPTRSNTTSAPLPSVAARTSAGRSSAPTISFSAMASDRRVRRGRAPFGADDARAEASGDLRGGAADAASGADQQHRLPRLQTRRFEAAPGRHVVDADRRRLVETEGLGLPAQARTGTAISSACEPSRVKPTSPPVPQTSAPIHSAGPASTTPAKSRPGMRGKVVCCMAPATFLTSLGLIEAAMTRTSAVLLGRRRRAASTNSEPRGRQRPRIAPRA